jgi:hypothetical protein
VVCHDDLHQPADILYAPPFAYALFYLRGAADPALGVTTEHIIKGFIPYVALFAIALVVFIFWPEIILWLPEKMLWGRNLTLSTNEKRLKRERSDTCFALVFFRIFLKVLNGTRASSLLPRNQPAQAQKPESPFDGL